MREVQVTQGSPEWHAFRLGGIGGSDAPVVKGNSPYRTPLQLAREKLGQPVVSDEDAGKEFIFARGHQTEALIRREFAELTGVVMRPRCLIHPSLDHVRASLDGFDSSLGVLEAKLVGQAVLAAAREGVIPAHHFTQMQHQFAVAGVDRGQWFGHDGKKSGVLVEVKADREYIDALLDLETKFWQAIQRGELPALSPMDYLTPEDDTLLRELRDAKELADNAKANFEAVRERAAALYGHTRIAGAGLKLIQSARQGSINYKSVPEVAALSADYLEKFRGKGSVSWSVRIDGQKASEE